MSFAVVKVGEFALQAVLRLEPELADRAVALLAGEAKKAIVAQVNARARAAGVEIGFSAPQAQARCAALVFRSRSVSAEKEAAAALVAAACSLAPRVELTAEGVCTVDLQGRSRGEQLAAAQALLARLKAFGLDATMGLARTPLLAGFAAGRTSSVLEVREERAFLAPLPLAVAEPSPELAEILAGWGIATFGQLTAMPKAAIGRRLGDAGARLWERAAGEVDRPITPLAAPARFEAGQEWEHEIETLEPLLFVLRRFVDRLALELEQAQVVANELHLELRLSDDTTYARGFRLPDPTGDAEILFRALHTHLETVQTASAIRAAKLTVTPVRPLVQQRGLFETGLRDPHGFAETLARLGAVVGAERLGTPRLEPTHRPDAFALEPPRGVIPPAGPAPVLPQLGLPLHRFRPPVRAWVEMQPQGPAHVRSDVKEGRVSRLHGPWRSSGDWWQPGTWEREEWDVALENGGVLRLLRVEGNWFVEGWYD